jgi:hypothetical protein
MKNCSYCGRDNTNEALNCGECGRELEHPGNARPPKRLNAGAVRSVLKMFVKVFAVITAAIGIYTFHHFVVPSFNESMDDYIISNKSADPDGYMIEFHLPDHPGEDWKHDLYFSKSFYNAAQVGDHLQMYSMSSRLGGGNWGNGYMRLVRDGRVIARELSGDQCHSILFILAALFPLLVFIPCKNHGVRLSILGLAALMEIAIIGIILFFVLIGLAIASGGAG